ncbi:predicted protein [Uncinocarpus reesii 1704]|uniref:CN hydrolase domain-containing protein n=1 Tax=Uncinocarpus reesii (strain UAMH 1704) TaxID=336963 RepID=C4JMZ9_UNCRE|nr:uncharacterized protein UREG_04207 [Uncinocarpus reesii 1704]EEP79361.1 predicted protein [Uncinocarpus reesii 1704]
MRELDLLVLPELAFTGYNFSSLEHIKPYLEPTGSGPSANWARSTARRLGCVVCVGYPELHASALSPLEQTSSLEKAENEDGQIEARKRFNSLLIVDPSGDILLNYQKRFLYYTDEPWALEGENGKGDLQLPVFAKEPSSNSRPCEFSVGKHIPTTVGICMDINPYKFIAPYSAYEFATHVLDSGAKLVILSMAWLSLLDPEELAGEPNTPDMDTFRYWIKRFWPLITRDTWDGGEIIVVFANRTGREAGNEGKDTARYAGSSCVIGIRRAAAEGNGAGGEEERHGYYDADIVLWERLGRAEEDVCLVDTDLPPKMRLKVFRGSGE